MMSNLTDDDDSIGQSFWALKRGRADFMFDDDFEDQAEQQKRHFKRQKVAMKMAYGVGYEWITEPTGCSGDGPHWQDSDHMFQGADPKEVDRVEEYVAQHEDELKQEKVLNRPLDFQRFITYPDRLFRESGLPLSRDLAGTYDIVFYAGHMDYVLQHHRTAKGRLTLSTGNADKCLMGTVDMDPSMDLLDIIPFGGNVKFEETDRVQRLTRTEYARKETMKVREDGSLVIPGYEKVDNSNQSADPTGVIEFKVTEVPHGMPVNRFNGQPCDYRGEIRILRERLATGIVRENHECSSTIARSKYQFQPTGTEDAVDVLEDHYDKTCSYLSNHTVLPMTIASKVGEFLCPPPVLFFEPGDVVVDFWWGGLEGFTYSQLIARRRASPVASAKQQTACTERPLTEKEKHTQEVKQYEEEIQKLEMKKQLTCLAFHCHQTIQEKSNDDLLLNVDFEVEAFMICQRQMIHNEFDVAECVRYMDEDFFNQQLARYRLRLESCRFNPGGYGVPSVFAFRFQLISDK